MYNAQIHAVITGDIVDSTKLDNEQRISLFEKLSALFEEIQRKELIEPYTSTFEVFRGDSFQGIFQNPEKVMNYVLLIRAGLKAISNDTLENAWDARIAIGLGTVEYPSKSILESDGEAFRNSGKTFNDMKGSERIKVVTPWPEINSELETACILADTIIKKWSSSQAEAIEEQIRGATQLEMADILNVSQSAVYQRLKAAGWEAISKFLNRYEKIILDKISKH